MSVVQPETVDQLAQAELAESVPRETMELLRCYVELLVEWQGKFNLVSPTTLSHIWQRHILDSAQLLPFSGTGRRSWIDMGSGAGFPGLVAAMIDEDIQLTLVESRGKKCVFLKTVAENLGLGDRVTIDDRRLEDIPPQPFDIISARALAVLPNLFDWGLRFASSSTQWILPKGRQAEMEIGQAKALYQFEHKLVRSRTDPDARIVLARHVRWKSAK